MTTRVDAYATYTKRSIKTTTRVDVYATYTRRSIKTTTRVEAYATYTRRSIKIVSSEIVSGCVIVVMKNLTHTERVHCCALFRPRTLS